jgi:hypothetical protein
MERFWNIIHYFAYRADYKLRLLCIKISPILNGLYKLPFAKKHFQKIGMDPVEVVKHAFKRPDIGISQIFSGALMAGLTFFILWGAHNIYIAFSLDRMALVNRSHFIVCLVITFVVNGFLLFHHDKYLKYFKEFDKMPRRWKIKWAWISLGVFIGILLFFIGSFTLIVHRNSIH